MSIDIMILVNYLTLNVTSQIKEWQNSELSIILFSHFLNSTPISLLAPIAITAHNKANVHVAKSTLRSQSSFYLTPEQYLA